jgi:hypothetical protein
MGPLFLVYYAEYTINQGVVCGCVSDARCKDFWLYSQCLGAAFSLIRLSSTSACSAVMGFFQHPALLPLSDVKESPASRGCARHNIFSILQKEMLSYFIKLFFSFTDFLNALLWYPACEYPKFGHFFTTNICDFIIETHYLCRWSMRGGRPQAWRKRASTPSTRRCTRQVRDRGRASFTTETVPGGCLSNGEFSKPRSNPDHGLGFVF